MQLIWQKGRFSWIASRSERTIQPDEHFPLVEAPADPLIVALAEQLLNNGGEAVVILFVEEAFCSVMIRYGKIATYNSISFDLGEPRQCHANSASLWSARQDELTLVTGYGLSDDKLWRRHSWLINQEQNLLETTEARVKYLGISLSAKQAAAFSTVYLDS